MTEPLTQQQAKQRVLQTFPPNSNPVNYFQNYSEQFYLDTLTALRSTIPFRNSTENHSLSLFLYAGCLRFERWFAPSPYVVPKNLAENFDEFVQALIKAEGGSSGNTVTLELHRIRNRVYAKFDECPVTRVHVQRLDDFKRQIQQIRVAANPAKNKEFLEQRSELLAILSGLQDRSLRTRVRTRLPYVLHRAPLSLSLQWNNIPTQVSISPNFQPSAETFAAVTPTALPVGASRWQAGSTTVEIEFAALIDGDIYTESLQAIEEQETPVPGWPKCFTLTFTLIHEISWHLRNKYGGEQQWVPAPRDLSDIELSLQNAAQDRISWKLKSSPANLIEGFTPPEEVTEIDLGHLTPLDWSTKCRSLAAMYVELGETNEALFWLNVAVEALFKERFAEIATQTKRSNLESELNSPKAFWTPAEEIVAEQFPEMADKVRWPETEVHVSIYAKLKYLYKNVEMTTSVKVLLRHYRKISEHRNALFHGVSDHRISLEAVQKAFSSYDWIVDNMRPAE